MKKEKNAYTVENAKVPVVRYDYYKRETKGYLHIDGGLVYVTVTAICINFKKQQITTVLTDKNGKEYKQEGTYNLYDSPSKFENNSPMEPTKNFTYNLIKNADWGRLAECAVSNIDEEDGKKSCYINVWTFENGAAQQVPAVINEISCDAYEKWHLTDGSLPAKFWESREDAFACNEYQVTDSDGEVFVEQGYQMRLLPTPAQWVIIKQMRALFEKAKEAGLYFVWDRAYCGNLKAVNYQNVYTFDYDAENFEGGDLIPVNKAALADTGIDFYDYCGDESDRYAFALNPMARQKKEWLKNHAK
jgi:hypothetical protein